MLFSTNSSIDGQTSMRRSKTTFQSKSIRVETTTISAHSFRTAVQSMTSINNVILMIPLPSSLFPRKKASKYASRTIISPFKFCLIILFITLMKGERSSYATTLSVRRTCKTGVTDDTSVMLKTALLQMKVDTTFHFPIPYCIFTPLPFKKEA